jgi:hypothetical protein
MEGVLCWVIWVHQISIVISPQENPCSIQTSGANSRNMHPNYLDWNLERLLPLIKFPAFETKSF